ncbi:MAG TPA: CHAD domain-containing protein [Vicinamibacterales bacterium]|nr:CHAD domain-containing protein [Vicinamibacterales bacterium]
MPASTQRHDLLRTRLQRFTRLLHGLEQGDVNAVHRTRVASRRLRELLPILELDHDVADKLGRRLRKVTSRLGTVRELDVLLMLIDEVHELGRHDAPALKRVADDVARERTRARRKLLGHKTIVDELSRIADKLDRSVNALKAAEQDQLAGPSKARGWRWALDARIARRAEALRDAVADAGAVYLPDRLHDVRIAVKKLRYALEIAAEATGARTTPDLRALEHAQTLLGRIHDRQVLTDRVRQVQASLAPPNIAVWRELDALTASLEDSCRRLHARYMRDRDGLEALADRVAARAPKAPARAAI